MVQMLAVLRLKTGLHTGEESMYCGLSGHGQSTHDSPKLSWKIKVGSQTAVVRVQAPARRGRCARLSFSTRARARQAGQRMRTWESWGGTRENSLQMVLTSYLLIFFFSGYAVLSYQNESSEISCNLTAVSVKLETAEMRPEFESWACAN